MAAPRIRSISPARARSSPAAARGSGFAIARGLGARRRAGRAQRPQPRQARERRAKRSRREGIAASVAPFDVTDADAVAAGIADVERAHGPVDILVNNAAMNQRKPLEEFTPDEWRALMAANLDGPFLVTRALLPAMKARRRGKIVNICSLAADLGRPNIVPYAASKGALRMLTRALAVELAPSNIQVNGIAPGFFKTEMNAPLIADAGVLGLGRAAHAGGTLGRAARDRRRRGVPRVVRGGLRDRPRALRRRRLFGGVLKRESASPPRGCNGGSAGIMDASKRERLRVTLAFPLRTSGLPPNRGCAASRPRDRQPIRPSLAPERSPCLASTHRRPPSRPAAVPAPIARRRSWRSPTARCFAAARSARKGASVGEVVFNTAMTAIRKS